MLATLRPVNLSIPSRLHSTALPSPERYEDRYEVSFHPEWAERPKITFHDLRHTCASLLFQKYVHSKFVQELLGHASVAITLDTYSHMLPSMCSEADDAMGEVLG